MGATHARILPIPTEHAPIAPVALGSATVERLARARVALHRPMPSISSAGPVGRLVLTGLVVAVLLVSVPVTAAGTGDLRLHLLLDAVDATCAIFGAMMLHARHLRDGRLQDLLLAQALLLAGFAGFGAATETAIVQQVPPLVTWAVLTIRLVSCLLILAAAFERGRLASRARSAWRTTGIPVLIVAALGGSAAVLGRVLPNSGRLDLAGIGTVANGTMLTMLLAAAIGFAFDARSRHEELLLWLGPAFLLAAAARLVLLVEPTFEVDRFGPVDLLRTGCYALLIAGAARDSRRYWADQGRALLVEDRRRMARELHDGVVQELVLIRMAATGAVAESADRALDEARAAVQALAAEQDRAFDVAVLQTARELEHRLAVRIDTDLDTDVASSGDTQHALLRILREAVGNAVRHGDAGRVHVRVTQQGADRVLTVADDGTGFDVPASAESGYGLIAMRDRAAALPGVLEVASSLRGTTVTVRW